MTRPRVISLLAAASFALVVVSGCGSGAGVSGNVTYDNQPVDGGGIAFFASGEKSPAASGRITGGRYEIPRSDKLPAGKYTVQISWLKSTGKKVKSETDPGTEVEETNQVIPVEYNIQSKLSVDISSGSNTHNFDLKAGSAPPPAGGGGQKKGGPAKASGDS
ncbi:MAG: hypothetical protein U0804_27810 [Gemmataceae bacterium]